MGEYDGAFRHQPILFLIGFVMVLVGFLLGFFGFSASFSSGGCFLWPLPLIAACGLEGSNDLYLALGLVLVTTVSPRFLLVVYPKATLLKRRDPNRTL